MWYFIFEVTAISGLFLFDLPKVAIVAMFMLSIIRNFVTLAGASYRSSVNEPRALMLAARSPLFLVTVMALFDYLWVTPEWLKYYYLVSLAVMATVLLLVSIMNQTDRGGHDEG